jgi:hypothetical protein
MAQILKTCFYHGFYFPNNRLSSHIMSPLQKQRRLELFLPAPIFYCKTPLVFLVPPSTSFINIMKLPPKHPVHYAGYPISRIMYRVFRGRISCMTYICLSRNSINIYFTFIKQNFHV